MPQFLPYLFLVACPLAMGLMMWMMRGDHAAGASPRLDPRLAELESQVNELKMTISRQTTSTAANEPAVAVERQAE